MRVITTILALLVISTSIAAQDEPQPPLQPPPDPPVTPQPPDPIGDPGVGGGKKAGETAFALSASNGYPRVVLQRLPPVKASADALSGIYLDAAVVDQSVIDNSTYTARALATPYLLPAPEEGNDIFYSQLNAGDQRLHLGTQPLGYAYFLGANESKLENVWTRFKAQPHFGFYYDTGQVGSTFDVTKIALGDPIGAGQTKFISGDQMLSPVILMGDAQLVDANALGDTQVQLLIEANNHQVADQLQVRSLFVRAWNQGDLTMAAGKGYSLFEAGGTLPTTLTQAGRLIGTGEIVDMNKPAQLRLQRTAPRGSWGWGIGIEDPETPDFTAPSGEELTRWPSGAAQIAYNGVDGVDRIQFCAMMRNLGFESAARQEHFATGWGLAAYAFIGRQVSESDKDGFYAGVMGGEAVGQYIQGITRAATFDGTNLTPLSAFGAYAGYKRQWQSCTGVTYGVNAAYGYAVMENDPTLPNTVNREMQQAWANFVVLPSNKTAIGVEYQFGRRETHTNEAGENHRLMLIVAFTTSAKNDGTVASASARALADESTPVPGTAALQRF